MRIRFIRSIAGERLSFQAGQIREVPYLPKGWQAWLASGVIEVLPEPVAETAEAPTLVEEVALAPAPTRRGGRRGSRTSVVA